MKKLLSILGIMSLTATASTSVVACGDPLETEKPGEGGEGEIDLEQLEVDFNSLIRTTTYDFLKDANTKLNVLSDTASTNQYLNFDNLTKVYGDEEEGKYKDITLTGEDYTKLENDFKNIYASSSLSEKIKAALQLNSEKFSIFMEKKDNIFDSIEYLPSISIRKQVNKVEDKTAITFQIKFDFKIHYSYYNKDGNLKTQYIEISKQTMTISNSQAMIDYIKNIIDALPKALYESKILTLTAEKLGAATINKPYDVKMDEITEFLTASAEFKETITQEIKTILNLDEDALVVELGNIQEPVVSKDQYKYDAYKTQSIAWESEFAQKFMFNKNFDINNEEENIKIFKETYGDFLNDEKFVRDMLNFFNKYGVTELNENTIKGSFIYGESAISSMNIKFNDIELDIPSINFGWDYQISSDNKDDYIKDSLKAFEVFHKTMGWEASTNEKAWFKIPATNEKYWNVIANIYATHQSVGSLTSNPDYQELWEPVTKDTNYKFNNFFHQILWVYASFNYNPDKGLEIEGSPSQQVQFKIKIGNFTYMLALNKNQRPAEWSSNFALFEKY